MCRFGMINNNQCERCQQTESTKHLLWGCVEARNIWELFNIWIGNNNSSTILGKIGNLLVYNKYLTDAEITQNYNAQKSRFGL